MQEWASQLSAAASSQGFILPNTNQTTLSWIGELCLPIIHGFAAIHSIWQHQANSSTPFMVKGTQATIYALISRRCTFRAGTRFFTRGVDQSGHAANTVETEQILVVPPHHQFSFTQVIHFYH
ncbi:unnamed protein product [Protopolystoma xenopodis]|uniref:Phosphatidylinositol-3-phosphatase SAC1 n=1 Tax=Protopolystoma xenopodis TaxID=117903 RepID=A0A448WRY1_9PLAT|nr:unnamed protein product [Protopolystoma xenopodis]